MTGLNGPSGQSVGEGAGHVGREGRGGALGSGVSQGLMGR